VNFSVFWAAEDNTFSFCSITDTVLVLETNRGVNPLFCQTPCSFTDVYRVIREQCILLNNKVTTR